MNRAAFLNRLRDGLKGLPQYSIDEIVSDYEAHFAEGASAGRSEDDVSAALGDPSRLARELRAEAGIQRWEAQPSAGNFWRVVLALFGLAILDFWFIFPVLGAVIGIFFAFVGISIAMFVCGVLALASMLSFGVFPELGSMTLRALLGVGLLSGSFGVSALLILFVKWFATLIIKFARLHYRLLDSANKSI